jgi:hypothetical protein
VEDQRSNVRVLPGGRRPPAPTAGRVTLVPVAVTRPGISRPVGAFAVGPDRVRFHPVVDVQTVTLALAAFASVAVAAGTVLELRRSRPAIGAVTMGPGGWVSVKNTALPPLRRAGRPRPWWARVLRARRLVPES